MSLFILVLLGSYVIPVIAAVLLAFRGQWIWVAVATTGGAVPHQLMGLTSTCTQGADGTFVAGAICSAPLLLIAIYVALRALYRRNICSSASWVMLGVPIMLLVLTQGAWINTLRFGTPCGEDFTYGGGSGPTTITFILVGYLLLPLLLAISAAGSLIMARRPSSVKRRL